MIAFRSLVIFAVAAVGVNAICIELSAQAAAEKAPSPSIAVSITLKKDHMPVGEKLIADVTVKNISDLGLCVSTRGTHVHIKGKDGEPPKTEYYRRLLSEGVGSYIAGGSDVCQPIAPHIESFDGMSTTFHFDLSAYYDLSAPGKYSVYIEFPDTGPHGKTGLLVSSPKLDFELEARKQ